MENTPSFQSEKFQCPHCQTIAQQKWFHSRLGGVHSYSLIKHMYLDYRGNIREHEQKALIGFIDIIKRDFVNHFETFFPEKLSFALCQACDDLTIWLSDEMVYPKNISLPSPNEDLDEDIQALYYEAGKILEASPKGATALLRLALQKLLLQVGKSGKNINRDIKELVAEGLSPKIQQGLDLLRVVGNNAVHPGQIDLDDNSEIALKLFKILNFIADELISKPKELESLYSEIIPEETQKHIEKRDKT